MSRGRWARGGSEVSVRTDHAAEGRLEDRAELPNVVRVHLGAEQPDGAAGLEVAHDVLGLSDDGIPAGGREQV